MAVAVLRVPHHPGHPRLGEAGAAGVGVETGIATIPGGARLHALLQALRRKALLRQAVLAASFVIDFEPILFRCSLHAVQCFQPLHFALFALETLLAQFCDEAFASLCGGRIFYMSQSCILHCAAVIGFEHT